MKFRGGFRGGKNGIESVQQRNTHEFFSSTNSRSGVELALVRFQNAKHVILECVVLPRYRLQFGVTSARTSRSRFAFRLSMGLWLTFGFTLQFRIFFRFYFPLPPLPPLPFFETKGVPPPSV